jgi:hypothetical protein
MPLPDPTTLTEAERAALSVLPPLELVRAGLARDPKASGRELAEWFAHPTINRGDVNQARARALRAEAIAHGTEPGVTFPGFGAPALRFPPPIRHVHETATANVDATERNITARLAEAFETALLSNDTRGAREWASLMKSALGPAKFAEVVGGGARDEIQDWSRLSDAEASCAGYLARKVAGGAPDPLMALEDAFWGAVFARVPPAAIVVHEAHVPIAVQALEGLGTPLASVHAPADGAGKPLASRGYVE